MIWNSGKFVTQQMELGLVPSLFAASRCKCPKYAALAESILRGSALIQIKVTGTGRPSVFAGNAKGGFAMPTDTAIVIAGIVFFFAVFALSLAWADFRTRGYRAPGSKHF